MSSKVNFKDRPYIYLEKLLLAGLFSFGQVVISLDFNEIPVV